MKTIKNVSFTAGEEIKCIEIGVHIDDEGHILQVPVYLYNVCPCRQVIVGVQVFVSGELYTTKTKKVFTGGCRCCRRISQLFVDTFDFLFTNVCEEDIDIRILAHYTC